MPPTFGYWFAVCALVFILCCWLRWRTVARPRKKAFLPALDLLSYLITSATLLTLVLGAKDQIADAYAQQFPEPVSVAGAREQLNQYLDQNCVTTPDCERIRTLINSSVAWREEAYGQVGALGAPDTELQDLVQAYRDANVEAQAQLLFPLTSWPLYFALALLTGFVIGLWRRAVIWLDAIKEDIQGLPRL